MGESREEGAGQGAHNVGSLGMPLYSQYEVVSRIELNGLDHIVHGAESSDEKIVADTTNRLVVARVAFLLKDAPCHRGQSRTGCNPNWVRIHNSSSGCVIDLCIQYRLQILNERAVQPDIQCLSTVADRQDRLVEVECILQQQFIDCGSAGIGGAAGRDPLFAVVLRIHIKTAPRKKNALGSGEEARNPILALMERDDDWSHAGGLECG